ncbi:MAG: hypothetical protein IH940_08305 [Acidobacteria bacterium]|nr:hypothetical protein [Acidobacteriota bacterium]
MLNEKVFIWIKIALGVGLVLVIVVIAIVALDDGDGGNLAGSDADTDSQGSAEILEDATDLTGQATVEISTTDNLFEPGTVIVSPGTEVLWTNNGLNYHNVKPDDPVAFEAIPTDDLAPGTSASRTFANAGSFGYYCSIHGAPGAGQLGAIIVL